MKNISLNFAKLDDLGKWYEETIGHNPIADDPEMTVEALREMIRDYLRERFTAEDKALPVVTLKGVKYVAALSDETSNYHATAYVDGVKLCEVSNRGHGGCDEENTIRPRGGWKSGEQAGEARAKLRKALHEINLRFQAFGEPSESFGHTFYPDFEHACGAALSDFLSNRDMKRAIGRKLHMRAPGLDGVRTVATKYSPELAARMRAKYPGAVILNELTGADDLPECRAWYFDDLDDPRELRA